MTVYELIKRLREMPDDLEVYVAVTDEDRLDISHVDIGEMMDSGFTVPVLEELDGHPVVDIVVLREDL